MCKGACGNIFAASAFYNNLALLQVFCRNSVVSLLLQKIFDRVRSENSSAYPAKLCFFGHKSKAPREAGLQATVVLLYFEFVS